MSLGNQAKLAAQAFLMSLRDYAIYLTGQNNSDGAEIFTAHTYICLIYCVKFQNFWSRFQFYKNLVVAAGQLWPRIDASTCQALHLQACLLPPAFPAPPCAHKHA